MSAHAGSVIKKWSLSKRPRQGRPVPDPPRRSRAALARLVMHHGAHDLGIGECVEVAEAFLSLEDGSGHIGGFISRAAECRRQAFMRKQPKV